MSACALNRTRGRGTCRVRCTALAAALKVPGFAGKFLLPRSASDKALLNAARSFAIDAAIEKEVFLSYDMPADFIDALNAEIEKVEQAVSERSINKGVHVVATAGIDVAIEKGVAAVRQLDAILRNKLGDDVSVVAWDRASHVERAGRPKPAAASAEQAASTAPPAPPQ